MSRFTTLAAMMTVARTLSANPLRTVLSTLGIVIGVAALVAVLSLVLFFVSLTANRRIIRGEAVILLVSYVSYIAWRAGG